MKTAEQYLAEAEAANDAKPWGFLNRRRAALAAIQAALDDARRPPLKPSSKKPPQQPTLFP